MPFQPLNLLSRAEGAINNALGANTTSASSGDGSRQNNIRPYRTGHHVRNLVKWFIPETGIVDMYINPENITTSDKKIITNQRTKGGYVLQYWGEDLTTLSIKGTTGSSGVEGINVLFDIYRGEQLAFDPFALALSAALDRNQSNDSLLGSSPGEILGSLSASIGQDILDMTSNALQSGSVSPTRPTPTLASLAFSVEMYWSGWTYRGYFTDFVLTESAQKLGMFDYSMTFMATQRRGFRSNFLGWHRSPTNGPSNSDPISGVPHSISQLVPSQSFEPGRQVNQPVISTDDRLISSRGYIGDPGKSSI